MNQLKFKNKQTLRHFLSNAVPKMLNIILCYNKQNMIIISA